MSQEIDTVRSNNIRAFLRSEEIRGSISAAVSTSKLNFNSGKYKINLKNKKKINLGQYPMSLP